MSKSTALVAQKVRFGYYAEANCTAGRANFIIGELPIRTGLTTVARLAPGAPGIGYTPVSAPGANDVLRQGAIERAEVKRRGR